MTLLSTTAKTDLSQYNSELVLFSSSLPGVPEQKYLAYQNRWFIGSRSGCSCSFRHLYRGSVELGFGKPEDWYPEDPLDIKATLELIKVVRMLVDTGEQVDCVDSWAEDQQEASLCGDIEVRLNAIDDVSFRLFDQHRFTFLKQA